MNPPPRPIRALYDDEVITVHQGYSPGIDDAALTAARATSPAEPDIFHASTVGAVDVHYDGRGQARAALVVCPELTFSTVVCEHTADIAHPAPYEPGALYKRELPCIRAVLALGPRLGLLIVDGYTTLDPQGRPGLGAHAADALGIPVMGIAKTPFRGGTHAVEVIRGTSTRPLYVTTAGQIAADVAAKIVGKMAGPSRIPVALARVDNLARGRARPIHRPT